MRSLGRLWQRGLIGGLGLLLVVALWAIAATSAGAQTEDDERVRQGEGIFQQICATCHTIGGGVRVGPDLRGVTERREESWLKVHIQSPSIQRAQNDPIALANVEKFGMPMPDLGLTEQQVEAVIAYLGTGETAPVARPALYIPTLAIGVLAIVGLTLIGIVVGTKRVEVRP
ncbi:MAG: cytochrome c [Chloroflexi bacterium]|nr:cytochrome c [Chloroflexota bacterium]